MGATCLTREQAASARFIAHLVTRWRALGASRHALPWVWRPVPHARCRYGLNLASPDEFSEHKERAQQLTEWDAECVSLLRRLESGRQPLVIDLFCAAGAVSEGGRRIGVTSVGRDVEPQPQYVARFGAEYFSLGDGLDRERLRALIRKYQPIGIWASPPYEGYSTMVFGGAASIAEQLISAVRDMLVETGLPFVIENVMGASTHMVSSASVVLRGQDFGLQTERPRILEVCDFRKRHGGNTSG